MSRSGVGDLTVAHVGHTGTDADRDRGLAIRVWLRRADSRLYAKWERLRQGGGDGDAVLREDHIDLRGNPPRDFLTEETRYDLVVTHNLWGFPELSGGADPTRASSAGPGACSPRHDREAWRRRLASCGARYVFMVGPHFNASYLGTDLPGYRCLRVGASSFFDVFASLSVGIAIESPQQPIRYRDMTAARLRHLDELSQNEALDLSYTELGAEHVERLGAMRRIQDLRLTGTAVSDGDLAQIAASGELRKLDLDETAVGPTGLRHLRSLVHLECLSLNHTNVDDAGLEHLCALPRLEWLSLVGTAVSDSGLARLRSLENLRYLSIVDTRVSAGGVERLRGALPACAVDFVASAAVSRSAG